MANSTITIKNGEGKNVPFLVTVDGAIKDLTGATFQLIVKDGTTTKINKTDSSFDKTDVLIGKVSVNITATDTAAATLPPKTYAAELKAIFTANTDVDISQKLNFIVEPSLF